MKEQFTKGDYIAIALLWSLVLLMGLTSVLAGCTLKQNEYPCITDSECESIDPMTYVNN